VPPPVPPVRYDDTAETYAGKSAAVRPKTKARGETEGRRKAVEQAVSAPPIIGDKTCPCSGQCTCGCNSGLECTCTPAAGTAGTAVGAPCCQPGMFPPAGGSFPPDSLWASPAGRPALFGGPVMNNRGFGFRGGFRGRTGGGPVACAGGS
jgi:hypothetical protein